MSTNLETNSQNGLLLPGLDGANPLGFLAALGTLQTITAANPQLCISMSWSSDSVGWRPRIHGTKGDVSSLARQIAVHLNCPFQPEPKADQKRISAQDRVDTTRRKFKKAQDSIKKQSLKGDARRDEEKRVLDPLRAELENCRKSWLEALEKCVPSVELSLGKHLNATRAEFREASLRALKEASGSRRDIVNLLASFGSDACYNEKGEQMIPTPFCFITGSGHQYFLDTIRQLTTYLDAERLLIALTRAGEGRDERLSMRWDPLEDRRYALMWSDPTSSDNVAKTSWGLNLLAYRGLILLPSAPTAKGLRTTGWSSKREPTWTWPIWKGSLSASVVPSLLAHPALITDSLDLAQLDGLGLNAVYQSTRIQVGNPPLHKINFSPAQCLA